MHTSKRVLAFLALTLVAVAPAVASADTVVDRFRIDAHGDVAGVILRDGTELAAPAAQGDALFGVVRPGATVRWTAAPDGAVDITDVSTGRSLRIRATRATDEPATVARGGGSPAPPRVDDAHAMPDVDVEGAVTMVTRTPAGDISGFVMSNGYQVHVVPRVASALRRVRVGDALRVRGRGTQGPYGLGLWAVTVRRPGGAVVLDVARGVRAPEIAMGR